MGMVDCMQGQDESITRRLQDLVEEYGLSCSAIVVLREPGAEARAKVNALCRWRHCRSLFSLVSQFRRSPNLASMGSRVRVTAVLQIWHRVP